MIRFYFDSLTASAPLDWGPNAWAALMLAAALLRNGLILTDMYVFFRWTFSTAATMRKNLIEHILSMPGARSLPSSTGEAISRFREDAEEVGNFMVWALFLLATSAFGVVALFTMLRINPRVTIFVFLPFIGEMFESLLSWLWLIWQESESSNPVSREANRTSYTCTGNVTGFIGEMFESIQAVQVAGAEESMLAHFEGLNETRRKSALRDRLFNEVLSSTFHNVVNIGETGADPAAGGSVAKLVHSAIISLAVNAWLSLSRDLATKPSIDTDLFSDYLRNQLRCPTIPFPADLAKVLDW